LGIVPCEKIILTPFQNIFSKILLENKIGHESLFESEINNLFILLDLIKNKNNKIFFIIDELMTGTNIDEGIANSYSFCSFISKKINVLGIISTHFYQICDIKNIDYNKFTAKNKKGHFIFDYKLKKGTSHQFIATELLKEKGYNHKIIDMALRKLSKS
jgi:DNA mismatch repair ATPase MutS